MTYICLLPYESSYKNNCSSAHADRVIWVAPHCEFKALKDALCYSNVTHGKKTSISIVSTKNIIFKRFVVILAHKHDTEL